MLKGLKRKLHFRMSLALTIYRKACCQMDVKTKSGHLYAKKMADGEREVLGRSQWDPVL